MNYYGRRRYRYSRYPRRSTRRTYASLSRSQRRASGNQRAARQQRDKSEVSLSIPTRLECFNASLTIPNPADADNPVIVNGGVTALNIWDLLRKSEFYQSYANMYDQVRIEKVTVRLTPYQFPVFAGQLGQVNNYYNGYTVVTAWDRTGLSEEQIKLVNVTPSARNLVIGANNNSDGIYVNIKGEDAATYSSAYTRNVNPNSNTTITRTIYPSSLQEKTQYINTADLDQWYGQYDAEKNRYYAIENPLGVTAPAVQIDVGEGALQEEVDVAMFPIAAQISRAVGKNPAYLLETPEVAFKPTLLVGILNDTLNIGDPPNQIQLVPRMSFNVEADVAVSFRGLRKASIVQ